MDTITITFTREELNLIKDALITQSVKFSEQSKTVGVDCMHPDFFHRLWNDTSKLWCKIYDTLIYDTLNPETEKED